MSSTGSLALGPTEAPNSTLMFDSSFEATLLAEGLDGAISHYAADSYLMNSADGSAGVQVQARKMEGRSPSKTPSGKAGASTDLDTVSELKLVPVSDCSLNGGVARMILYELQRVDSTQPNGHYNVTEHLTNSSLACSDHPAVAGMSTDFGGWESKQNPGDGNEYLDRLGNPLIGVTGSVRQSFSVWKASLYQPTTNSDGTKTYDACTFPSLTQKAVSIRYAAQNGHPSRNISMPQNRFDAPVSVRGFSPFTTEWITGHPVACVFNNWNP